MKVIDIVTAYAALSGAKLSKLEDKEKFALIRAMKALKPIHNDYEDFVKDARERLKPDDFDARQQEAEQWNAAHKGQKMADLTPKEQQRLEDINRYFADYTQQVEECVKDEAQKDVSPDYARLAEGAFGRLLESNPDWTMDRIVLLSDVLCEN